MRPSLISLLFVVLGCNQPLAINTNTPPVPELPPPDRCRCLAPVPIVVLRVDSDPEFTTDFVRGPDEYAEGWRYDVTIERARATSVTGTLRVHHVSAASYMGRVEDLSKFGGPQTVRPVRGSRLFAIISAATKPAVTPTEWRVALLPFDETTNTITRRWYQFPVGTSIDRVFDPTEWNNPCRACTDCGTSAVSLRWDASCE
jgi:hypothetical protein